jgi:mRNA interferase RelE/StbE
MLSKIRLLKKDANLGKPLLGPYKGTRSLRVGPYRILYEVSGRDINIYSIKHRRDVYR